MNYAALKFGEAGVDVLKYVSSSLQTNKNSLAIRSLRPLIVALVPGQKRSLDKLKAMRVQLSNEVAGLINDFGPTLYEDFNEVRSLVNYQSSFAQEHGSGAYSFLLQVYRLRVGPLVCGVGRVVLELLMPKDWDLHTQ